MDYTFIKGKPSVEIDRGFKRWLLKCCQIYKYDKKFALDNAKLMQKLRLSGSNASKEIIKRQIDSIYKKLISGITKDHTRDIYLRQLRKIYKILNKPFNMQEFVNLSVDKLYSLNTELFNKLDKEQQRKFYTSFMVRPVIKVLKIKNTTENKSKINDKIKEYIKEHYHLPEDLFIFAKDNFTIPKALKHKKINPLQIDRTLEEILKMAYLDITLDDIEEYDLKQQDFNQYYTLSRQIINFFNELLTTNNQQALLTEVKQIANMLLPIYNRIISHIKKDRVKTISDKQTLTVNSFLGKPNNNIFFNRRPQQLLNITTKMPENNKIFVPQVINPVRNPQPQPPPPPNNDDIDMDDNNKPDDDNNDGRPAPPRIISDGISSGFSRLVNRSNEKVIETANDVNTTNLQNLIDNDPRYLEVKQALEKAQKDLEEQKALNEQAKANYDQAKANYEEEKAQYEQQKAQYEQEKLSNQKRIKELSTDNKKSNFLIGNYTKEIDTLKSQITRFDAEIAKLKAERDKSNTTSLNEKKALEKQISDLQNEKNALLTKSQDLENQLNEKSTNQLNLSKTILDKENEITELNRQIVDESSKNLSLEAQLNDMISANEANNKTIEELNNKLDSLTQKLAENEEIRKRLEEDINNKNFQLSSQTELESQLARANALSNSYSSDIKKLKKQINELNTSNLTLNDKIIQQKKAFDTQYDEQKQNYENLLNQQKETFTKQLDETNKAYDELQKENIRKNEGIAQLQKQATEKEEEFASKLQNQKQAFEKVLGEKENEYSNAIQREKEAQQILQNQINAKQNEITSLNTLYQEQGRIYEEKLAKADATYREKLAKQIEYNKANNLEKENEIATIKAEHKKEIEELEKEKTKALNQIQLEKAQLEADKKALQIEINKKDASIVELQEAYQKALNAKEEEYKEKLRTNSENILNAVSQALQKMDLRNGRMPTDEYENLVSYSTPEEIIKFNDIIKQSVKNNPFLDISNFKPDSNKRYRQDDEKETHIQKDSSITQPIKQTPNDLEAENKYLKEQIKLLTEQLAKKEDIDIEPKYKFNFDVDINEDIKPDDKKVIKKSEDINITETNSNVNFNERIINNPVSVPYTAKEQKEYEDGTKNKPITVEKPFMENEIDIDKEEPKEKQSTDEEIIERYKSYENNNAVDVISDEILVNFVNTSNAFKSDTSIFTKDGHNVRQTEFEKFKARLGQSNPAFKNITWRQYKDFVDGKKVQAPKSKQNDINTANIIDNANQRTTRSGKVYSAFNIEKLHNKYASRLKPEEFDAVLYNKLKKNASGESPEQLNREYIETLKTYDSQYRPELFKKRTDEKLYDNYTGSSILTGLITVVPAIVKGIKKLFGKNKECLGGDTSTLEENEMYKGSNDSKGDAIRVLKPKKEPEKTEETKQKGSKKSKKTFKGCAVMSLNDLNNIKNAIQ